MAPDLNRINPVSGIGKIFSLNRLVDGVCVTIRLVLVTVFGVCGLWATREQLVIPAGSGADGIARVTSAAFSVIVVVALMMCIVAVFEYGYRWWQHENSLRMSSEEMREDRREQEGDLHVRALRRGAHQDITRRRFQHSGETGEFQAAADSGR